MCTSTASPNSSSPSPLPRLSRTASPSITWSMSCKWGQRGTSSTPTSSCKNQRPLSSKSRMTYSPPTSNECRDTTSPTSCSRCLERQSLHNNLEIQVSLPLLMSCCASMHLSWLQMTHRLFMSAVSSLEVVVSWLMRLLKQPCLNWGPRWFPWRSWLIWSLQLSLRQVTITVIFLSRCWSLLRAVNWTRTQFHPTTTSTWNHLSRAMETPSLNCDGTGARAQSHTIYLRVEFDFVYNFK